MARSADRYRKRTEQSREERGGDELVGFVGVVHEGDEGIEVLNLINI